MATDFSCCSFYVECDYGKKECYFAESEPSKKERCRCYQLKKEIREGIKASNEENKQEEIKDIMESHSAQQLSLF